MYNKEMFSSSNKLVKEKHYRIKNKNTIIVIMNVMHGRKTEQLRNFFLGIKVKYKWVDIKRKKTLNGNFSKKLLWKIL